MEKKIYNLIILDESGSMQSIKPQAITGLNETLQTIKSAQEKYENQSHYVTLVSFNTNSVKTIYDCCPANCVQELRQIDYQPNAGTPLYDAMGISLTQLMAEVKDEDNVLVTIITDGYENASREYSGKAIFQLIENLKAKGWIFTYIGANQDVEKVASSMGIQHSLLFDADEEGAGEMFRKERESRKQYYCCISEGMDARKLSEREYFKDTITKNATKDSFHKKEVVEEITSMEEWDPLIVKAAKLVVMHQQGSMSLLQRKLVIGYNYAWKLMDQLEKMQIVGPNKGAVPREVYCKDLMCLEEKMKKNIT